jgi:hypothetical protein
MRSVRVVATAFALAAFASAFASPAQEALIAGFKNPPKSAKPQTWWHWMNGNISAPGITADLEAMKAIGLGGAEIFNVDVGFPNGPAPYMGTKWRALVRHAEDEAKRLGLELTMHNGAGWSSTGGPWITPDEGMQVLAWSTVKVHGPTHFDEVLPAAQAPQVERHYPVYHDIVTYAYRTPPGETAEEIASRFKVDGWLGRSGVNRDDSIAPIKTDDPATDLPVQDLKVIGKPNGAGRISWDVPAGDWTILRLGYTPTGMDNHPAPTSGHGLEVDKLSREALDVHFKAVIDKVIADAGPNARHSFDSILIDSYEVGTQNWTPKFRADFTKLRGYDPLPYLPAVTGRVVGNAEVTERFLWDMRRTIADLYGLNYYGYFRDLLHKRGFTFANEPYGNGGFDTMLSGGAADIPMGEFWPPNGSAIETTKLASAVGHTYGRPVIGAEAFTSDLSIAKYKEDPYSIKALGDRAYVEGINRFIFHRYAHQPWMNVEPGMTMGPWGLNFERTITWWNQGSAWINYLTRCQYLLQSGHFVADALYYIGENEPADLPFRPNLRPAIPDGYDYDGCDTDVLLNQMKVRDGKIVLKSGMTYRVLVMPQIDKMSPRVIRKIRLLVQQGATVVAPKPTASPSLADYPECDNEVHRLANEVWSNVDGGQVTKHQFGSGRVVDGVPLKELFAEMGVSPDFAVTGGDRDAEIDSIHRATNNADFYFVSNQAYRPVVIDATFRVHGRMPELWHADTGATEPAPVWYVANGKTHVRLPLDPAGSVFVVFRHPFGGSHLVSLVKGGLAAPHAPVIHIGHAAYLPDDGSSNGVDVTEKIADFVAHGHTTIPVTNGMFGDPAVNHVKHLEIDYTINGKPMKKSIAENDSLVLLRTAEEWGSPDYDVRGDKVVSWAGGTFTAKASNGKTVMHHVAPALLAAASGPWNLTFPPNWGAPAHATFPSLISWPASSNDGIKYFSGTATYHTTMNIPAFLVAPGRVLCLDLGKVKNFARVKFNGHDLGILWKAPFRLDVTGMAKAGANTLEIQVTNLWPNRLIGDEQQPPEVQYRRGGEIAKIPDWLWAGKGKPKTKRYTFTTWHFYDKNSPLMESGLIGPVVVRSAMPVKM